MLQNIQIKGFKSIKDLSFDLSSINILIGANGVGKSNFISFFKLVNQIYEQRLQQYSLTEGTDNLLYFGRKTTKEIKGQLIFEGFTYTFELQPSKNDGLFISEERSFNNLSPDIDISRGDFIKESTIICADYGPEDIYLNSHIGSCKIYHFHDTSNAAALRTTSNIDDNKRLKEDGENIAAYLYLLQQNHPKSFKRIEKTIQSIAPFFKRFNLEPDRLDESRIKLEWSEKENHDKYFNAAHLSDGSLRFIALATLLSQPNLPEMLIIDEPELGLHPKAINKLAGLIKSAAQRGCQIIISTQSINLLNQFTLEDIITVDRNDNQSNFNRLESKDFENWLDDYSLGELWTKSVIKGQPF